MSTSSDESGAVIQPLSSAIEILSAFGELSPDEWRRLHPRRTTGPQYCFGLIFSDDLEVGDALETYSGMPPDAGVHRLLFDTLFESASAGMKDRVGIVPLMSLFTDDDCTAEKEEDGVSRSKSEDPLAEAQRARKYQIPPLHTLSAADIVSAQVLLGMAKFFADDDDLGRPNQIDGMENYSLKSHVADVWSLASLANRSKSDKKLGPVVRDVITSTLAQFRPTLLTECTPPKKNPSRHRETEIAPRPNDSLMMASPFMTRDWRRRDPDWTFM